MPGAEAAIATLNARGGVQYRLETFDDGGDPSESTRLVRRAARSDGVAGVVFAGPPRALPPAEPALARAKIPAFLLYGDLYGARLLQPHVFQASPSFLWEARRIAQYLVNDRGYARIGLLAEDSLMGQTARSALRGALGSYGASLAAAETFSPGALHRVERVVQRLRDARVDALVLEATPGEFDAILSAITDVGATYRDTRAAKAGAAGAEWRPQVVTFDLALNERDPAPPPGTIASDTYARGAHYLPVPSFVRFRDAFEASHARLPLGWERRAFEASRMIAWADEHAADGRDRALVLETVRGQRFGGLDVTLGPDDHTTVDETTVGLWVVPRRGLRVPERRDLPRSLPWVPLWRGFAINAERVDVLPDDWRYLFKNPPPKNGPGPDIDTALFGVKTYGRDPVH